MREITRPRIDDVIFKLEHNAIGSVTRAVNTLRELAQAYDELERFCYEQEKLFAGCKLPRPKTTREIEGSHDVFANSKLMHEISYSDATLRDQFAMAALTGLLSNHQAIMEFRASVEQAPSIIGKCSDGMSNIGYTCAVCYDYADAMMRARDVK